jgi:hypothetical protein
LPSSSTAFSIVGKSERLPQTMPTRASVAAGPAISNLLLTTAGQLRAARLDRIMPPEASDRVPSAARVYSAA